jgi:hypothetical protein
MYLVLNLTNGDGYSSPDIELFFDRGSAMDKFAQYVGYHIINEATITDSHENKILFLSDDECDNYGVHMIELDDKKHHSINIDCNYSDEITIHSYRLLKHAREVFDDSNADLVDISTEKRHGYGMVICSGGLEAGHDVNVLIRKRKEK